MSATNDRPEGGSADAAQLTSEEVRRSLEALLNATIADPASAFGYALAAISFGTACEFTLQKGGASFVLWLRPASDTGPSFRTTARFKIGYRRDPPDERGFALLHAACAQIQTWERSLSEGASRHLFDGVPSSPTTSSPPVDATIERLLSQAVFSPIYQEWLEARERCLQESFEQLKPVRETRILLVNATKGVQYYTSIVDFFAVLQRTQPAIRVASASYFDDTFEFHEGAGEKGLSIVPIAELMTWGATEVNQYDAVILVGPSDAMVRLMALDGITAKLILLDLGFYHQLIDAYPGAYVQYSGAFLKGEPIVRDRDRDAQRNRVVAYSCQPKSKIEYDLSGVCSLRLMDWRWFNYIPIGFTYCKYYLCDRSGFDVALLGTVGRVYSLIDPNLFRGVRFLFLGNLSNAPELERLRDKLDITVVSRVNEDTYARLLALCRCVVMPVSSTVRNVLCSVIDSIAEGRALVTQRHEGLARLADEHLPAVFAEASPHDLCRQVDALLRSEDRLQHIEADSVAFAKDKLDIYRILSTILREQLL